MEYGTVRHYNPNEGKKFGFIEPDGKPNLSVFFHCTRQRVYVCDGGPEPAERDWVYEATVGDRVVFETETTPKGLRAKFWGFADGYDKAVKDCADRPAYRFRERNGREKLSRLQPTPTYRTLWQGKDLREVRTKYSRIMGDSYFASTDAEFLARYWERWNEESDTWEACEDPRR